MLCAPYVRYVDDFALFTDDPTELQEWRARIDKYLVGRRLLLRRDKTDIVASNQQSEFLGLQPLPTG